MILYILVGFVSGIISGMGIGGGTLLIPMLVFFGGIKQQSAQNINLIYFIPTAVISLITHRKNNNIETKIIFRLVLFGILGALIGSFLANKLDSEILKKLFGGFLLIMGIIEFFKKSETRSKDFGKRKAKI